MRIAMMIIIGLFLLGCSQTPSSNAGTKTVVDETYIASVEQAAQKSAVDVIWVNPPTKQVKENN